MSEKRTYYKTGEDIYNLLITLPDAPPDSVATVVHLIAWCDLYIHQAEPGLFRFEFANWTAHSTVFPLRWSYIRIEEVLCLFLREQMPWYPDMYGEAADE